MADLLRLMRLFVSDDVLIRMLRRLGRPDLAWQLARLRFVEMLRDDPTYTYTLTFAEHESLTADLALQAGAYEWAWINAADALAVLEWKGALDDDMATSAKHVLTASEQHISRERLADLRARHTEYKQQHNTPDELAFKKQVINSHKSIWRRIVGRARMPRITDRPD